MGGDAPEVSAVRTRVLEHGRFATQQREHLVRYAVDEVVRVVEIDIGQLHAHPPERKREHVPISTLHSPVAMSDEPHLIYERDGHIAVLTMNRPESRNSLSGEMLARMYDAWVDVDTNTDIRVAILTGAGGTFCSGMDLKAF